MAAPLSEVLERAGAVLAELHEAHLDGLADDGLSEAVLAVQRLRGRLDAAEARFLARWDAQRCWQPSGAKTGAAWLAWKQRIPVGVARQRLRHARALRSLPAIERAWAAGDLDRAHVTTLLGARTPRTAAAFDAGAHEWLLDLARAHGFVGFKSACDRWSMIVDPDGAEQGADADRAAREVHLAQTFGGMWFGKITLDPISGEIVDTSLRLIERELVEADWAEAKVRLGRQPTILDLRRTPPSAGRTPSWRWPPAPAARLRTGAGPHRCSRWSSGSRPLCGPVVELFNRTVVTPGTVAPYLTDADVDRIVFDGRSRVLDVGRRRRFFRGALRRAIEVRDRTCFHPSCDEVPERFQVDHIHEASKGGETTQENGQGGCGFHNRWKQTHREGADDPDDDCTRPID